jgi:hypothetical protein
LTSIVDGTYSLRPHGWARDNGEQAADEKILFRGRAVVVVTDSKTGWSRSLLVLKKSMAVVECK